MKNICVVTSKSLDFKNDFDGANILTLQLIKYLKECGKVDVIVFSTSKENLPNDGIEQYKKAGADQVNAHCCQSLPSGKFLERMDTAKEKMKILSECHALYDYLIIIHISNIFGIETLSNEIREKIILFPMFLGKSYKRSSEHISDSYFNLEKNALKYVKLIFTPSHIEKKQMIEDYEADENKVVIMPRGIDLDIFSYRKKTKCSEYLQIAYIAAIRKQKNHLDLIPFIKALRKYKNDFIIHLTGKYEKDCFNELFRYLETEGIAEYVKYHGVIFQGELAKLLSSCDINISVSKCETFGRGIYEGLLMGIPTIVYRNIGCLWEHLKEGEGIIGVDNSPEMAEAAWQLYQNSEYYGKMNNEAFNYREKFNENNIMKMITQKIMGE